MQKGEAPWEIRPLDLWVSQNEHLKIIPSNEEKVNDDVVVITPVSQSIVDQILILYLNG